MKTSFQLCGPQRLMLYIIKSIIYVKTNGVRFQVLPEVLLKTQAPVDVTPFRVQHVQLLVETLICSRIS